MFLLTKEHSRWGTCKDGAQSALFQNFCVVLHIVCFVSFCVVRVCICVLYYCHQVSTQLHLTNISYHVQVLLKKAGASNRLG